MTRPSKHRQTKSAPNLVVLAAIAGGALLALVAAVSVLGGSSGRRAAIEVNGQPRLKVDREVVELGDIPLGQAVEAAFVLTNVGDQSLRLTQAPYIEVVEGC